jgi:hypothetical protein
MTSLVAWFMALYSASLEDFETVVYFFVFQDMGAEPSFIKNPVVDFRVSGHDAQSESQ